MEHMSLDGGGTGLSRPREKDCGWRRFCWRWHWD